MAPMKGLSRRRALVCLAAWTILCIGSAAVEHEPLLAQVRDPVAEGAFRDYRGWKRANATPMASEAHNDTLVVTYLNPRAESLALAGKFPLPEGAILVKESFASAGGKPGARGPVFVMEKRARGYDPANADWHWAVVEPDGKVTMSGAGRPQLETALCAECHARARTNDFVFGRGTDMKVRPIQW
jgi:hypothetical protein